MAPDSTDPTFDALYAGAPGKKPPSATETGVQAVGKNQWLCCHCLMLWKTKALALQHVKTAHIEERNHACAHCDRRYKMKHHLTTHEKNCPAKLAK